MEVLEDKLVCFGAEGLNGECVAVSLGVALPDEVGPVDVALLLEEALGSPPANLAEIPAKLKKEMLLRYISMGKCRFSTGNTEERLSVQYSSTKYEHQYVPRQSSIIKHSHSRIALQTALWRHVVTGHVSLLLCPLVLHELEGLLEGLDLQLDRLLALLALGGVLVHLGQELIVDLQKENKYLSNYDCITVYYKL